MNPVEAYLLKLPKNEQEIASFFHTLLVNKYKLIPAIKWNIPTYAGNFLICYLNPDKKSGLHLSFMQGYKLSNTNKMLKPKNRKKVTSYHITSLDSIPYQALINCIEEAISIDRKKQTQ